MCAPRAGNAVLFYMDGYFIVRKLIVGYKRRLKTKKNEKYIFKADFSVIK